MTVAELKKLLADQPDDLPVLVISKGNYRIAESVENIEVWKAKEGEQPYSWIAGRIGEKDHVRVILIG